LLVLKNLYDLTGRYAYFLISCKEASRKLPDGRNAHIFVMPPKWWIKRLQDEGFTIMSAHTVNDKNGTLRDVRLWLSKQ
jgi:hypothetical protein